MLSEIKCVTLPAPWPCQTHTKKICDPQRQQADFQSDWQMGKSFFAENLTAMCSEPVLSFRGQAKMVSAHAHKATKLFFECEGPPLQQGGRCSMRKCMHAHAATCSTPTAQHRQKHTHKKNTILAPHCLDLVAAAPAAATGVLELLALAAHVGLGVGAGHACMHEVHYVLGTSSPKRKQSRFMQG